MSYRNGITVMTAAIALIGVTGCPLPGTGTGGATDLAGTTWTGTLDCSTVQSVGDVDGNPQDSELDFQIEFDENGRPVEILVVGFSGTEDETAMLQVVGDSEVIETTNDNLDVTQTVSVSSVVYSASGFTMTLSIEYQGTDGNVTNEGTGTQTIEVTLVDDELQVDIETDYEVEQAVADVTLDTGEMATCSGTLTEG